MEKRPYLLEDCIKVPIQNPEGEYSLMDSVTVVDKGGVRTPLVEMKGAPSTHSKTFAHPGDDDPEPGQERCY